MTCEEVARHFNAKRIGKGKWIAKCTAHPDRKPSLSITEGKRWVLLRCWSQNCATEDILKAAGLTMEQLAYDSGRKFTPQHRAALNLRRELEVRERRLGLMDFMHALEPSRRRYWTVAIENTEQEIIWLRLKLYPGERLPVRLRGPRRA